MSAQVASASTGEQYASSLREKLLSELGLDDEEVAEDTSIQDYVSGPGELDLEALSDLEDHPVISTILEQGRVIKEYARDVDEKLRAAEMASIQEYIQESSTMVQLHDQIKNCDSVLSNMEQLLGRFQGELGKVSEEIRQLQVQSQLMGTKLKNRKAAEGKLGTFIEHLTVSEDMVNSLLEADVNEDYLEYLLSLDKKLKFVNDDDIARTSHAKADLEPALERLRIKALTKVRDFMLQKIYQLKRPKTNVQIIQQSVLLKYKYFVRFLRQHGFEVYNELRSEYIGIVSRILSSHFRTYLSAMEKMVTALAYQTDLLGASDASGPATNVFSIFHKDRPRAGARIEAVFELGERAAVLDQLDKPAIIPHMAEYEGKKFPYEIIFRNVHKLLIDTATSEYFFCIDFFEDETAYRELMAPIIAVVEDDLVRALQENWDMVGVMLMIRINSDHRRLLAKRKVTMLDNYLDRVHMLLWPRLMMLFDSQLNSVRGGTERQLFNGEATVHVVVRRYAQLASSMLLLMSEYDSDVSGLFKAQTFYDMMDRLWATIFDLLLRMSNLFKDRRTGIIFLIVNYHHVSTVLRAADATPSPGGAASAALAPSASSRAQAAGPSGQDSGGTRTGIGRTGATAIKECEDQLASCTGLYVEDQLTNHFPMLLEFVKKAEQQQKRLGVAEGQVIPNFAPAQAGPILRDFAVRWQGAVEDLHREVARDFSAAPPGCSKDVLQASMTSLLKYYTRMLELLKRQGADGQALVRDAVNIPSIMYEIKRITKA